MSHEFKLLMAALRMAIKDPASVGQRSLSMLMGASRAPEAAKSPRPFVRRPARG